MKNTTYKSNKIIDLTKGENFMSELMKMMNLKQKLYYINVFEGKHILMQIEVENGEPIEIIDFSGKAAPYIVGYLKRSLEETVLEVEVKGAIA